MFDLDIAFITDTRSGIMLPFPSMSRRTTPKHGCVDSVEAVCDIHHLAPPSTTKPAYYRVEARHLMIVELVQLIGSTNKCC